MTPRLIARELWPNVSSFIEELALALNLPTVPTVARRVYTLVPKTQMLRKGSISYDPAGAKRKLKASSICGFPPTRNLGATTIISNASSEMADGSYRPSAGAGTPEHMTSVNCSTRLLAQRLLICCSSGSKRLTLSSAPLVNPSPSCTTR